MAQSGHAAHRTRCPLLALSGHRPVRCTRPLMTQSGHRLLFFKAAGNLESVQF
jgi:hypothetical protein